MAELIPATTVVSVRNVGTETVKIGYDNNKWAITAGDTTIIPYFAACLYFGDPRAQDIDINDPDKRHRTAERNRLNTLYGLLNAPWTTDRPYIWKDSIDPRPEINREYVEISENLYQHPNLPRVVVAFMDGERVTTVIDDPEGDGMDDTKRTALAEKKVTGDAIAEMRRELAQMQYQLSMSNQKIQANPDFEGDVGAATEVPAITPDPRPSVDSAASAPRRPGRPRKDTP